MTEAKITKEIKLYMMRHEHSPFFLKVCGGGMQKSGIPDFLVCYKGMFVALEVKQEKGRVSNIQKACIKEIQSTGGIAEIVRSVEEVAKIFKKIDDCLDS